MGNKTHKHDFWEDLFAESLPKTHLYAAACVAFLIVALLVIAPSGTVSAYREASLSKPEAGPDLTSLLVDTSERKPAELLVQLDQQIQAGDNLSEIFQRMKLDTNLTYAVSGADAYADELTRLRPGEVVSVVLDDQHAVMEVIYQRSELESFRFVRSDQGFRGEKFERTPSLAQTAKQVTIEHSLFQDGVSAGLSHRQIMDIANIFGWDIDFALDLRKGDHFTVVYEDKFIDGRKIGSGDILSASFTNQGNTYEAVQYTSTNGETGYYTPDGKPMKKAFLRAPLDFTRVSSNFNPNRLHPVFKTKRPHRGVDYAAPRGTPVYAAGNGKVIKTGYSNANGKYVFIQHGNTYTTKYLHLSKISVKQGQTIKQRQQIGAVGSTGYATGPHLHYEFLVNGTHTNPRTVKLPQADPIAASELARFRQQTAPLLAQLEAATPTQLAAANR
jgi:Membrane proteins related to metalloendopeptidases